MNKESAQRIDECIDRVYDHLEQYIKESNFIVTKCTDMHKSTFEDTRIDMEVINLTDYENAVTKRIINLTTYDTENRPITLGNICYRFNIMNKPEIKESVVTELGNIVLEYGKNNNKVVRYLKTLMCDGKFSKSTIDNIIDIDGNILEKRTSNEVNGAITNTIETYTNGRMDKSIENNHNGTIINEYSYNAFGSVILKRYTFINRSENSTYKMEETTDYDENDRIIRCNILKKQCDGDDHEYKVLETVTYVYSYYNIDGFDVRLKTNLNNPSDNVIRIMSGTSTRYIDYEVLKRKIIIMDDNIASATLSFTPDFREIMVNHANVETDNRCLCYRNDRYNKIDNLKIIKILDDKTKISKEYKGRAEHGEIVKTVTDIFEKNFNFNHTKLFEISKKLSAMINVNFIG